MTAPVWLIAERELRTYVATASFWAALAIGPLAAGALLMLSGDHQPTVISIRCDDSVLQLSARTAVAEAARLEGKSIRISDGGERLVLRREGAGRWTAVFSPKFPLSRSGRALVERTLERNAARLDSSAPTLAIAETSDAPRELDSDGIARFALVCMLWLTLTGSLGMLLQAVVRERANRALESLLAAARPWDIIVGKLAGVGAVSVVVLGAWLGSAVLASIWLPPETGAGVILSRLAAPAILLRAAVVYVVAYAFYGAITIALGALARDVAAAQNLSRPMFIVLVIAFFVALGCAGAPDAGWLVFVPPFTPFLMLLAAPGAIAPAWELVLIGVLLMSATVAASFGAAMLSISRSNSILHEMRICLCGVALPASEAKRTR